MNKVINKYESTANLSYTLGMSLTLEALKGIPENVKCIYLSSKVKVNEHFNLLQTLAKKYHIPVIEDDKMISKLSLKENCYCIALFEKFYRPLKSENHILLFNYQDEGSLGTTLRSAVSFDEYDIVLINPTIDYFSPRTVRASMGAIFHTNIVCFDSLESYLQLYPKNNLYPLVNKGVEIQSLDIKKPYSFILPYDSKELAQQYSEGVYLKCAKEDVLSLESRSSIALCELYQRKRS